MRTGRCAVLQDRVALLFFGMLAGAPAFAGERRIEAESGVVSGGAVIVQEPAASGGGCIASMHHGSASCTLRGVDGLSGGAAEIALVYASHDGGGRVRVKVNGKDLGELSCPGTGGWNRFAGRVSISAELLPGTANTIEFLGGRGGVNLDYVVVTLKASATPAGRRALRDACFLVPGDVVLLVGDAITVDGRYAARALAEMRKRYPELATVRLVNAGVPGATWEDMSARLDGLASAREATVAVVCLGLNDVLTGRADSCLAHAQAVVRGLSSRGIAVTVLAPPAMHVSLRPELAPLAERLARLASELSDLASREGVLFADCHSLMRRSAEAPDEFSWGDGIHPDERGHATMAEALLAAWKLGRPLARSAEGRAP